MNRERRDSFFEGLKTDSSSCFTKEDSSSWSCLQQRFYQVGRKYKMKAVSGKNECDLSKIQRGKIRRKT